MKKRENDGRKTRNEEQQTGSNGEEETKKSIKTLNRKISPRNGNRPRNFEGWEW